ncbi:hypothetical protein B5M09_013597 [Aphanomyces astaci]|uniref:Crinkler (CRN) family protein n=1 Tax=Aphanomyces astaci TaxID=112090 RepID=A0A425DQ61_APHAT|nr:hypothetical protein B5M09_013597 [Aphanomyces astaci]
MTILLTKPIHEVWFEFNEDKCDFRYMPVWAWDEILTCHSELYSKLALDVVTDCFRRWGGVPRYVLRYALVDTQQLLLEDALDVAKCDWVVNAIGKLEANCPESHRLLHYQVDSETFINHHVDFASHYVQDKVYKRLRDDNERRLVELLAASYNGSDNFTVLYTRLFERYVHSVLPHGGSFRIRRLIQPDGVCPSLVDNEDHYDEGSDDEEKSDDAMDTEGENVVAEDLDPGEGSAAAPVVWDIDGKKGIVHVPRQQPVEFNSDSEVATAAIGVYLRPTIKHDLSVDAIVKPDVVVTIAAKHPCKQKDLNDVLNLLGNPPAPRLFFVVPPNGFADFQYQQYVTQEGTPTTHLSASVRSIHQYVMQVTPSVQAGMTQHPSSDEGTKKRLRDE